MKKPQTAKQVDRRIEGVYRAACSGMQISVMKIPQLFREARAKIAAGASDAELAAFMVSFVDGSKL